MPTLLNIELYPENCCGKRSGTPPATCSPDLMCCMLPTRQVQLFMLEIGRASWRDRGQISVFIITLPRNTRLVATITSTSISIGTSIQCHCVLTSGDHTRS